MTILEKEEQLYLEQMEHWIEEQEMITRQLQDTVKHYKDLSESNAKQLALHTKRTQLSIVEFEKWKSEHGITT